ncbi:MAG TPA: HEAT repeat domain-containing protein [Terriglobia bacterium]|nr:HEAT repeat domain-containing protein [Terriglobia bacterium]
MKDQMQFVLLLALTASLPVAMSARQIEAEVGQASRFTAAVELAGDAESPVDGRVLVASWAADSVSDTPGDAAQAQQGDALYKEGTQALDDHQWQTAVDKFTQLASLHGNHADEALYWKAYALNKEGQREQALSTLDQLGKAYPQSRWLKDAQALQIQMRQASGQQVQVQDQPDEDLKLLAINGLMNSDPQKAVPLLEKFIQGDQPAKLKERALFVLSQSGSPQAREAVAQIARGSSNPELQKKALDDLALFGGKESRQLLAEIYASSSDVGVKRQILHDFMISGDRDRLLTAAKSERVPELRIDAIHQLGLVGAQDQLWELYQQETATNVKKEIIHAMFLGGNSQRLFELARTERDPELRREAIHSLGLMGAQDQLGQLYTQETSVDLKKEILHSMFLGGNGQRLIEIARTETNPELRREAIHSLGLMGGKQTGDALASIYASNMDAETRKAVVDALFIQGNAHALIETARKETDPEMKKYIVSKISLMGSKEGTDYMLELLNH